MAAESLMDFKLDGSKQLAQELLEDGAPLVAAFWDFREDIDRWTLILVPTSTEQQAALVEQASSLLVRPPFRSIFSISDPTVDRHQIDAARALAAYVGERSYIGQRIDNTVTSNQYFESVIPVYLAPELMTHLSPA